MKDTYKTIKTPNEAVVFKDRGSKFYGYAFPMHTIDELSGRIDSLKKEHHSARHWCYAYQLGPEGDVYRVNDDGEPSNSAGQPIYGQLQAFELTDVLVVVVRYFGGTKLGVGGLINAYRTAAQMALEASKVETRYIQVAFKVSTPYSMLSRLMRMIDNFKLEIEQQQHSADDVILDLKVRASKLKAVKNKLAELYPMRFIPTNSKEEDH